jgi:hypothetical protein
MPAISMFYGIVIHRRFYRDEHRELLVSRIHARFEGLEFSLSMFSRILIALRVEGRS